MQVTLSKNSWHYKIQKYITNHVDCDPPQRNNLCPYFWLTILCLFLSPFFYIVTNFIKAYTYLVNRIYSSLTLDKAVRLYIKYMDYDGNGYRKYEKAMINKIGLEDYHKDVYPKIRQAWEKYLKEKAERKRKERKRKERRKKQMDFVVRHTKWIAITLITAVSIAAIAGLTWLTYTYLLPFLASTDWYAVLIASAFCVGLILVVLAVFGAVSCLFKLGLFSFLFKPFKSFGSFVFLYIKSTKDNYCPIIKWED